MLTSTSPPSALVLLSTYNGADHLAEQIDSILGQKDVRVTLQIRDDGSKDSTPDLLTTYATRDPRIQVLKGSQNLGVVGSFLTLLENAESGYDLFAFADQDDWWLPDKLSRAAAGLASLPWGLPGGYCARVALADQGLNRIGHVPAWPRPPSFGNALVENIAIGCSLAINDSARKLVVRPCERPAAQMHDWLVYQVVSGCGRMLYDPRVALLYRQHARNEIGTDANRLLRLTRTARNIWSGGGAQRTHRQNRALARLYSDVLPADARQLLHAFLDRPDGNLSLAVDRRIYRQFRLDDAAMRLLLLTGRL